jgi:hypothetical protein
VSEWGKDSRAGGGLMVETKTTLKDIVQGYINQVDAVLVAWIIRRRGVEFLYWCDVPGWEKYLRENPEYDPSKDGD